MLVGLGAIDEIEVIVLHRAAFSRQAADGSGIVKQQVAVDIVEGVDTVARVQLGNGVDIAVCIREADVSWCVDAVAKEKTLVHTDALFVDGIGHDDALIGAYLWHIL